MSAAHVVYFVTLGVVALVLLMALAAFCLVCVVALGAVAWLRAAIRAKRVGGRQVDLPSLPLGWRKKEGG